MNVVFDNIVNARDLGGLIGAGMARVPMECFEKAFKAYCEKYGL